MVSHSNVAPTGRRLANRVPLAKARDVNGGVNDVLVENYVSLKVADQSLFQNFGARFFM